MKARRGKEQPMRKLIARALSRATQTHKNGIAERGKETNKRQPIEKKEEHTDEWRRCACNSAAAANEQWEGNRNAETGVKKELTLGVKELQKEWKPFARSQGVIGSAPYSAR
jgi:hypothetical protein